MYAIIDSQKWNHELTASVVKTIHVQPVLHIPETSALPTEENEVLLLQSLADATKAEDVNMPYQKIDFTRRAVQLDAVDRIGRGLTVEKKTSRPKRFLKSLQKMFRCSVDRDGN